VTVKFGSTYLVFLFAVFDYPVILSADHCERVMRRREKEDAWAAIR
jgi:hypothetical protein